MTDTGHLQKQIEQVIQSVQFPSWPQELYDPISYILTLGGKRIRPLLSLMACELFGGNVHQAIYPAIGLEFFHNFTLIHDDIMDQAPLRRGKPTIHTQWNTNRAILSGDTLFVLAYEKVCQTDPAFLPEVLALFNTTAREVCEGQQLDMNFETREDVSIAEYLEMIRLKTAVLIACSVKLGAILAGANTTEANAIYQFGENLGMAFQLQDDYLDVFGDPVKFGKQSGGDILTRKKTYLYLKALENGSEEDQALLKQLFSDGKLPDQEKVERVTALYRSCGVDQRTGEVIQQYIRQALDALSGLDYRGASLSPLKGMVNLLLGREF